MNGTNSNTSGANVATIDFIRKATGDSVSDTIFAEIVRRLGVTFEGRQESDIWSDPTEPTDKTLIWWPKDPTSGTRIGQPKVYDSLSNTWIPLGGNGVTPVVLPEVRTGNGAMATGVVNVGFTPFASQSPRYSITISPTTYNGSTYGAGPANMTGFGWIVTNKANNQFSIQFFAAPASTYFDWRVEEIL